MTDPDLQLLKHYCFDQFTKLFDFETYKNLSDAEILAIATQDSQAQLLKHGIPFKSNLTKIKTMGGLPRLFGFAYGGIAYHDLITGEIVIPSKKDYPSSVYFRAKMIYHEVGHSLYYGCDIQNNIFQTQAMLNSKSKLIQSLAYLMILGYTDFPLFKNLNIHHNKLYSELLLQRRLNKEQFSNYYVVKLLKNLFVKSNIQNTSVKYGYNNTYLNNIYLRNIHTVLTPRLLYLKHRSKIKEE